jgi:hypothetical protein
MPHSSLKATTPLDATKSVVKHYHAMQEILTFSAKADKRHGKTASSAFSKSSQDKVRNYSYYQIRYYPFHERQDANKRQNSEN